MRWTLIAAVSVLALAGISGCGGSSATSCGPDIICPPGMICSEALGECFTPEEHDACAGLDSGDVCQVLQSGGVCDQGVCILDVCGNGVVEPSEECELADNLGSCTNRGFDHGAVRCADCRVSLDSCGWIGWQEIAVGFGGSFTAIASPSPDWVVSGGNGTLTVLSSLTVDIDYIPAALVRGVFSRTPGTAMAVGTIVSGSQMREARSWLFADGAWTDVPLPDSPADDLTALDGRTSPDGLELFAVGSSGAVLRYDGSAWEEHSSPTTDDLTAVWTDDGQDLFVGASDGRVHRYDGTDWTTVLADCEGGGLCSVRDLWGTSNSDLYVIQKPGLSAVTPLRHFDGSQWEKRFEADELGTIWGSEGGHLFASAPQALYYSADGLDWVSIERPPGIPAAQMRFAGVGDEIVATASTSLVRFGGSVWTTPVAVGLDPFDLAVSFAGASPGNLFVGTLDGHIYNSIGGVWGQSYVSPAVMPRPSVNGLWVDGASAPIAANVAGQILEYDSGLDSWSEVYSTSSALFSLWGSGSTLYSSGRSNQLQVRTAGIWGPGPVLPIADTEDVRGLWGFADDDIYAVTNSSVLHYDGEDWTETVLTDVALGLTRLWGANPEDVHLGGGLGLLFHELGSGFEQIRNVSADVIIGIFGAGPDDVFATGSLSLLHYDGELWSPVRIPTEFYQVLVLAGRPLFTTQDGNVVELVRTVPWR